MRMARPGPGDGWRCTTSSGKAEVGGELADFKLEKAGDGLDDLHVELGRQAADVVVRLQVGDRLDDVGVIGALYQSDGLAALPAGVAHEGVDETGADGAPHLVVIVRLALRVGSAVGQRLDGGQEVVSGVKV